MRREGAGRGRVARSRVVPRAVGRGRTDRRPGRAADRVPGRVDRGALHGRDRARTIAGSSVIAGPDQAGLRVARGREASATIGATACSGDRPVRPTRTAERRTAALRRIAGRTATGDPTTGRAADGRIAHRARGTSAHHAGRTSVRRARGRIAHHAGKTCARRVRGRSAHHAGKTSVRRARGRIAHHAGKTSGRGTRAGPVLNAGPALQGFPRRVPRSVLARTTERGDRTRADPARVPTGRGRIARLAGVRIRRRHRASRSAMTRRSSPAAARSRRPSRRTARPIGCSSCRSDAPRSTSSSSTPRPCASPS
jgi:hypothetical protein